MKNKLIVFLILGIFIFGIFIGVLNRNNLDKNYENNIAEAYVTDNGFYESTNYETDNGYIQEIKIIRYKPLT